MIRDDCVGWLTAVEPDVPSLIVYATDGQRALPSAHAWIDGSRVGDGGEPFEVDPGRHVVRVEAAGLPPVETTVVVRHGERRRIVEVTLRAAAPRATDEPRPSQPTPARAFRVPVSTWVVGGIGLGVLATGIGVGAAGLASRSAAGASCAPFCSDDVVQRVRGELIAGDVLGGVGIAALVVAGILLFVDQPRPSQRDGRPR